MKMTLSKPVSPMGSWSSQKLLLHTYIILYIHYIYIQIYTATQIDKDLYRSSLAPTKWSQVPGHWTTAVKLLGRGMSDHDFNTFEHFGTGFACLAYFTILCHTWPYFTILHPLQLLLLLQPPHQQRQGADDLWMARYILQRLCEDSKYLFIIFISLDCMLRPWLFFSLLVITLQVSSCLFMYIIIFKLLASCYLPFLQEYKVGVTFDPKPVPKQAGIGCECLSVSELEHTLRWMVSESQSRCSRCIVGLLSQCQCTSRYAGSPEVTQTTPTWPQEALQERITIADIACLVILVASCSCFLNVLCIYSVLYNLC